MLLRAFETMLGPSAGFLVPEENAVNRSLTVAEAELVRLVPVEAAARAALGAFIAAGAGGRSVEETVRDLDTRSLAKALAKRYRQRVRRALPR
jgi:hypothetical protein